jgi:hypothetical protein
LVSQQRFISASIFRSDASIQLRFDIVGIKTPKSSDPADDEEPMAAGAGFACKFLRIRSGLSNDLVEFGQS